MRFCIKERHLKSIVLYNESDQSNIYSIHERRCLLHANTTHHLSFIYNQLKRLSWYVFEKIINTFAERGFHTIGALKTNRVLYPFGIKKKLSEFAVLLSVTHSDFDLVTVKSKNYYVYRYEGKLNGVENAVVLLSYPEKAFGNPKALRAFLSTDVSLSTDEILPCYVCRWQIEVFFLQCKDKLALGSYQIRSAQGI